MAKKPRLLIDTNIALDLLLAREPFAADAIELFSLADRREVELFLSADSLSTIFYIIQKNKDVRTARNALFGLLDFVKLAVLDEASVLEGLALDFEDVEDAFICAVALKAHVQAIISRDAADFANSPLPVMNAREFLASYSAWA